MLDTLTLALALMNPNMDRKDAMPSIPFTPATVAMNYERESKVILPDAMPIETRASVKVEEVSPFFMHD